jgi:hypothetical protein
MTNDKQQTSLDWYISKITRLEFWVETKQITWKEYHKEKDKLIEQAKEMEKEQIMKSHISAGARLEDISIEAAEQYYNETYGGN